MSKIPDEVSKLLDEAKVAGSTVAVKQGGKAMKVFIDEKLAGTFRINNSRTGGWGAKSTKNLCAQIRRIMTQKETNNDRI